ncbi:tetratricopeptide (TPR) repeat protein [Brevibacillus aydinogluensis]|jgi:tetratricopeptide (TPR) repeat protein|uniref:helix-turn-helix domain-containing protein n=1 Tax=Brevibacillus aydinogluensis TaxID=927786 RepID=UPI002892CA23|nr:helix-turn-helix domain-containing protein [Brevibacillus aydinogluensis]MDT3418257.1 tetratricopeptide (TPR) repeat protein [Brevibacillus aydinogluensis]
MLTHRITWEKERKRLGLQIRHLRRSQKLTQDELGAIIRTSRQTINTLEKGLTLPKVETIEDIAVHFDNYGIIMTYIKLQDDVKSLFYLAERIYNKSLLAAQAILKKAIKINRLSDMKETVTWLFQSIIWDLEVTGRTNNRKVKYVIDAFGASDTETFIDLLDRLYNTCFEQGKKFEAFIKICEAIIEKIPVDNDKSYNVWYNYSKALYYQKKFAQALIAAHKCLEFDHENLNLARRYQAISGYGLICLQLREFEEALKAFKWSLHMAEGEELHLGLLNLGRTYFMMGDYEEANIYWNTLLKKIPDDHFLRINALNDMAMVDIIEDRDEKAAERIEIAKSLLEKAKVTNWHMYKAEKILCERNEAVLYLKKVLFEPERDKAIKQIKKVLSNFQEIHLRDDYELTKNYVFNLIL